MKIEAVTVLDDKLEAQRLWDRDPCGAVTAAPVAIESAAWYASVRRYRYDVYAPWLPAVIDARRWRGKDVLEIGVGLGSDHLSLVEAGANVHALDLSAVHLRHTQHHLAYHGFRTEARLGDAERNPWSDSSFDMVYSFGVLHHTPGTDVAICEVLRVLRPGGTAIIGLYHRDSWFYWLWTVLYRGILRAHLPRKGWRRLLSEIEYHGGDNDALPLVKVFSRRQARRLFAGFATVRISSHCVDAKHFPLPLGWLLALVPRRVLEHVLRFGGWYLIIEATKGPAYVVPQ